MRKPRTPARQSVCSAGGCCSSIPRGRLMCRPHWFALPKPLRDAINENWKARRIREWSANCLEARAYLAGARAPAMVTPEQSYALNQRMLGERPDA